MESSNSNAEQSTKTKRPSDSAFKQQKLSAWQPILTAGTVLPAFFVIGIAFIPIGVGLLYFSDAVKEISVDYTRCVSSENKVCADVIEKDPNAVCTCNIPFNLETDLQGKIFMYYGLSNFYQNHRRYVKSRDDYQLLGHLSNEVADECHPFSYVYDNKTKKTLPIAPCGAIANSLFSDELKLFFVYDNKTKYEIPLLRTGIAWDSDKRIKFKNPDAPNGLKEAFKDFSKPKAWKKHIYELDTKDENNNGFQNEDLIVWMRTSALPTFRKLYRIVNHTQTDGKDVLIQGTYELFVNYSYDVKAFDSTKRMILSTTSLLGGKNSFLGIAYITVGCICLLLGIIFLFVHIKYGKSATEMVQINPRTPWTAQ